MDEGWSDAQMALAVMTAWLAEADSAAFAGSVAAGFANDPAHGVEDLVAGFINLTGMLLRLREQETGVAMSETVQSLGRQLAEWVEGDEP